jgi:hypothetical protein
MKPTSPIPAPAAGRAVIMPDMPVRRAKMPVPTVEGFVGIKLKGNKLVMYTLRPLAISFSLT